MQKLFTTILIIAICFLGFGTAVFAIEEQFVITQVVTAGSDITDPSIPTSLTATAVSQSQIDLTWSASTDNVSLTGYVLYRAGVAIATTTLTNYSNTGLSASTLYTYTVVAYDSSLNYSDHSAPASATTFAVVIADDETGPTSGGGVILLKYLSVSPDLQSANIRFGTNVPVRVSVQWGETLDYELGSLATDIYLADHSVNLTGLDPSTRYFFRLELVDGHSRRLQVNGQQFTTLSLPDIFSPANVSNFRATPSFVDIKLTWENPRADFELVRIVKSDKFYPRDPSEGEVIYEGRAETYVDEDVVHDKTYYYTAFSRDRVGNFSSGSVTDGRLLKDGEEPGLPKLFAGILQLPKELIHPLLQSFTLLDIDFIQDGKKLPVVSNSVEIRGDRNLTISIAYEKVPEILKTIAITMFDPQDRSKTFSFLLRVNKDKTAYEAHIGAFEQSGTYEFALAILDHKHQGLGTFAGVIVSQIPNFFSGGVETSMFSGQYMDVMWMLLVLLILVAVMYLVLRRKNKTVETARI